MQLLVTGGAGFIGSHLVRALAAQGHAVRVLDNFSSGRAANLADCPVEIIAGDVADWPTVRQAVTGCDLIFHQAALVSPPQSIAQPDLNHRVNVTGAFHVFEAARQAGVRRVVYASSAAVYGRLPGLPKRESDPTAPLTPYGAAKVMNETEAGVYNRLYGLECMGLRYMNVYGPWQVPTSPYSGVLSIFGRAAVRGEGVTIWGDGEQTRDFVFVGDVVQVLLAVAAAPFTPENAVFNVGRGVAVSLNQAAAWLSELVNRPIPITYAPERPGDIRHSCADLTRLVDKIGFRPNTDLKTGLAATLAWLRAQEA